MGWELWGCSGTKVHLYKGVVACLRACMNINFWCLGASGTPTPPLACISTSPICVLCGSVPLFFFFFFFFTCGMEALLGGWVNHSSF